MSTHMRYARRAGLAVLCCLVATVSARSADEPAKKEAAPAAHADAGHKDHGDAKAHAADEKHGKADASHGGSDHGGAGGHDEGPPLDFKADLALWSVIVFVGFVFVLKKMAWGPLVSALDNRETRLLQIVADAEASERKSRELLAEHKAKLDKTQDQVKEILAEAKRDAERTRNDIVSAAQAEAEAAQKRALEAIEQAKKAALLEVMDKTSERIVGAAQYLLGRELTPGDHERLVTEALAQFAETP